MSDWITCYPLTKVSFRRTAGRAVVTLAVTGQPDFDLTVNPSSQIISAGQTATYSLAVNPSAGFNSPVTLVVSGLPAGVTGSFNPPSGTPPYTSVLMLSSGTSVPAGNYAVTITASGGGKTHSDTVAFNVQGQQAPTQQQPAVPDFLAANWLLLLIVVSLAAVAIGWTFGRRRKTPEKEALMTVCQACGTKNPSTNTFCSRCGKTLR